LLTAGCDTGPESDAHHEGFGLPVQLVGQNVGPSQPLVVGTPIEVAFDRLLAPSCITRQTFLLQDASGNIIETTPSYDPVARVVRLCPIDSPDLQADQTYRITFVPPQNQQDSSGLHAIDGAGLDPGTSPIIEFQVVSGSAYAGPDGCTSGQAVDFCGQVLPIFASKCGGSQCHAGSYPAAGLLMTTAQGIQATAIHRAAQGANTGVVAAAQTPGLEFGVDMPIIDPLAPGDSWLMYKVLLANPPACSSTPGAAPCDAGAPAVGFDWYPTLTPEWSLLSSVERSTLSDYVAGREMPFPSASASGSLPDPANGDVSPASLTADELETVSAWILQGAGIPGAGCGD
jgi:hypothetical protein